MLPSEKAFSLLELLVIIAILGIVVAVAAPNLSPMKGRAKLQADWSQLIDQLTMYQARAINSGKIYSACPETVGNVTTVKAHFNPGGCACSGGIDSTDEGESLFLENIILSQCTDIGNSCTPIPAKATNAPVCFYSDGHADWSAGGSGIIKLQSGKSDCSKPNTAECYGEYVAQIHVATGYFDKFQLLPSGQWQEIGKR